MFSKSKQTGGEPATPQPPAPERATVAPEPQAAAKPALAGTGTGTPSIISAALKVTGNLDCAGDMEIKGTIDGDVKARNVRIDQGGKVNGKIVAESAYVDGLVRGQIIAKVVALAGSANVQGDILHETLSIEAGAMLDGNCRRLKDGDRAQAAPKKPKEETIKPIEAASVAQAG